MTKLHKYYVDIERNDHALQLRLEVVAYNREEAVKIVEALWFKGNPKRTELFSIKEITETRSRIKNPQNRSFYTYEEYYKREQKELYAVSRHLKKGDKECL